MYAKIYREIFIKNYVLKQRLKDNIWRVKVNNTNYYLFVYDDIENVAGFKTYNEAELLQYRKELNTMVRIYQNKKFLDTLKNFKKSIIYQTSVYLFKKNEINKEVNQVSMFDYYDFCC